MVSTNALIGFEENGGFMFGPHNQVRDGCMTLGLMLDLLSTSNDSLSEKTSKLPASFTTKDKISCSSDNAKKLIQTLKEEFPYSDTTDGIKISHAPKTWIMIRPSGTEPIVRIYGEAETQKKLDSLMSEYIKKAIFIISR